MMLLGAAHTIGAEVSSRPAASIVVDTGVVKPDAVRGVLAAHRNQSNVFWGVLVSPIFAFLVVVVVL